MRVIVLSILCVASAGAYLMARQGYEGTHDTESNAAALPVHTVEMTSLNAKGHRIQINVQVDFLPKSDCENLINHYKDRAKPSGQVSIHGPSPKMRKIFPDDPSANDLQVWAYDNLDGTGIHYNDYNYGLVEEQATSTQRNQSDLEFVRRNSDPAEQTQTAPRSNVQQRAAPRPLVIQQQQLRQPQAVTVYVTRTGSKYHLDGCRSLSRSNTKTPMNLSNVRGRYGPCSICRPPS